MDVLIKVSIVSTMIVVGIFLLANLIIFRPIKYERLKYLIFFNKLKELTGSSKLIINDNIVTEQNILLDIIYVRNRSSKKCFMLCHGNYGNITNMINLIKLFYQYGSVVVFDYRGYGKSTGNRIDINFKNMILDAVYVWNYIKTELKYKTVYLCGETMGSSVALGLTNILTKMNDKTELLILINGYSNMDDIIKQKMGINMNLLSAFSNNFNNIISFDNLEKTKIVLLNSEQNSNESSTLNLISNLNKYSSDISIIKIKGDDKHLVFKSKNIYELSDIIGKINSNKQEVLEQ